MRPEIKTAISVYRDKNINISQYDDITKLYTKTAFQTFLMGIDSDKETAIIYMDLDRFKNINIMFGHAFGNMVLNEIANRISECGFDIAARVCSDEFLIAKTGLSIEDKDEIYNLLKVINKPLNICGNSFKVTASIGISSYFGKLNHSVNEKITSAEIAMFKAKKSINKKIIFFDEELRAEAVRNAKIVDLLINGHLYQNMFLVFQPEINLRTNKIVALEALLRLKSDELGLISPSEFIPMAESLGVISRIENWVIEKVCYFAKLIIQKGLDFGVISINISPLHLCEDDFVSNFINIIQSYEINPNYIQIEITEGALIKNINETTDKLLELKGKGISIALDDFGVTYSTLNHLVNLPVDVVKIDSSFIRGITDNKKKQIMIKAITDLAHSLGYTVVAEGVDNIDKKNLLKSLDCDVMQGYLFSEPISFEKIVEFCQYAADTDEFINSLI